MKAAISKVFPDFEKATIDLFFENKSSAFKGKPPTVQDMA